MRVSINHVSKSIDVLFRTRFAPSPTGPLHLGHAYAAWVCAQQARQAGGVLMLRIEDIDHARCRPQYVQALCDDLRWLGISYCETVWYQSHRLSIYQHALVKLKQKGLLYPCCCTRKEVLASCAGMGPDGPIYGGTCRHRSIERDSFHWRLDMQKALAQVSRPLGYMDTKRGHITADPARFGDVVLSRQDIGASYHIAVVVDDAAQGITQVTRGQDLQAVTAVHVLIQPLLGLPIPAYHFHALVGDGKENIKLSKRKGSQSLLHYRNAGLKPDDVIALAKSRIIVV